MGSNHRPPSVDALSNWATRQPSNLCLQGLWRVNQCRAFAHHVRPLTWFKHWCINTMSLFWMESNHHSALLLTNPIIPLSKDTWNLHGIYNTWIARQKITLRIPEITICQSQKPDSNRQYQHYKYCVLPLNYSGYLINISKRYAKTGFLFWTCQIGKIFPYKTTCPTYLPYRCGTNNLLPGIFQNYRLLLLTAYDLISLEKFFCKVLQQV